MTSCKYDYAECNVSRDFEYFSLREGKYLLNCLRFNGYMNHFNNSQGKNYFIILFSKILYQGHCLKIAKL